LILAACRGGLFGPLERTTRPATDTGYPDPGHRAATALHPRPSVTAVVVTTGPLDVTIFERADLGAIEAVAKVAEIVPQVP
jgi:hypothetical protein